MHDSCFLLAWKRLLFSKAKSRPIERPLEAGVPLFPMQTQVPLHLLPSILQAISTPPPAPLPTASCPGWANSCKQQDSAILAAIPCSSEKISCGGLLPHSRSGFNPIWFMQFISEKQTSSLPTVGVTGLFHYLES